jgi:hypothetical protein
VKMGPPPLGVLGLHASFQGTDVSAVHIIPSAGDTEQGTLTFYTKPYVSSSTFVTSNSWYLKKPSMYAAMISDKPQIYDCSMKSAFTRLRSISNVYLNRTSILSNYYSSDEDCFNVYKTTEISNIITKSGTLASSFPADTSFINTDINNLKSRQENLRYSSCPNLY